MRNLALVASFAAIWISVASCSGTGTSSTGSGGADAGSDPFAAIVDKFCSEVAGPFCEADWTCCLRAGLHFGNNVDDCKTQVVSTKALVRYCVPPSQGGDRADLEASLRAGTTTFNQAQFDTCLALLKSMAAGGAACVRPPAYVVSRICQSAFEGQIPPGEPCTWQDFLFEDSVMQCKDSRCETGKCIPFLKAGDTCPWDPNLDDTSQPAFMICNYAHDEWCKRPLPDGGVGDNGTCAPLGDVGDACDPGNYTECKGSNCDAMGKCGLPDPYTAACYSGP